MSLTLHSGVGCAAVSVQWYSSGYGAVQWWSRCHGGGRSGGLGVTVVDTVVTVVDTVVTAVTGPDNVHGYPP